MDKNNRKPCILVTGGGTGLGNSIVSKLSSYEKVFYFGRRVEAIQSPHISLSGSNRSPCGLFGDVTDINSLTAVRDAISAQGFTVSVLICNAGVAGPIGKFLETNLEEWQKSSDVNYGGVVNCISVFLPAMLNLEFGRVIHISGGGATTPLRGMTSYSASKAAAVRFIETLSVDYEGSSVTFNSIAPGIIKSRLLAQILDAGESVIGSRLFNQAKKGSSGTEDSTEKAIELIKYLISKDSSHINGKLISAEWDRWWNWKNYKNDLSGDLYTLRRITGRERGVNWGDRN